MDSRQPPTPRPPLLNSAERRERVIPLSFQFGGMLLNLLSRVHNEWAAGVLARFWFSVFKTEAKPWVEEFWQSADECRDLAVEDVSIPVYRWGEGPLVVLMHGWSGSGTQFRKFIPPLLRAGFRVVCFDAPEHGRNAGKQTHMLRFSASLVAIQDAFGEVECVIAHSLGAMATIYALRLQFSPARTVLVAPHLDVNKMFETYRDLLNMRPALARRFHQKIGSKMAQIGAADPWGSLVPERLLDNPRLRGMLVYDSEDPEIAVTQFEKMAALWPAGQVHRTRGLGHNRILKDSGVIDAIVRYLQT